VLAGKRALIDDDDIRNIFAMSSFLERYEVKITPAETGRVDTEHLLSLLR